MTRSPRVIGTSLATGLTLVLAGAVLAPAASAATTPVTTLSFAPNHGTAATPMYLIVPQPCPAQATNVIAEAYGHGFPATGQPVVGNSTAGISHTGPFVLPLQDTFTGFAAENGTVVSGSYRITLRCIDALISKTYASFSATVSFSTGTHFTAPAPAASVLKALNPVQATNPGATSAATPGPLPSGKAGSTASNGKSGAGSKTAGAGSSSASHSGTTAAGNPGTAAKTTRHKGGASWQPALIVAAFVLIGLAILLRIREMRRPRKRGRTTSVSTSSSPPTQASAPRQKSPSTSASTSVTAHDPDRLPTLTGSAGADNSKGNNS